jgi:hypothetical protein
LCSDVGPQAAIKPNQVCAIGKQQTERRKPISMRQTAFVATVSPTRVDTEKSRQAKSQARKLILAFAAKHATKP